MIDAYLEAFNGTIRACNSHSQCTVVVPNTVCWGLQHNSSGSVVAACCCSPLLARVGTRCETPTTVSQVFSIVYAVLAMIILCSIVQTASVYKKERLSVRTIAGKSVLTAWLSQVSSFGWAFTLFYRRIASDVASKTFTATVSTGFNGLANALALLSLIVLVDNWLHLIVSVKPRSAGFVKKLRFAAASILFISFATCVKIISLQEYGYLVYISLPFGISFIVGMRVISRNLIEELGGGSSGSNRISSIENITENTIDRKVSNQISRRTSGHQSIERKLSATISRKMSEATEQLTAIMSPKKRGSSSESANSNKIRRTSSVGTKNKRSNIFSRQIKAVVLTTRRACIIALLLVVVVSAFTVALDTSLSASVVVVLPWVLGTCTTLHVCAIILVSRETVHYLTRCKPPRSKYSTGTSSKSRKRAIAPDENTIEFENTIERTIEEDTLQQG